MPGRPEVISGEGDGFDTGRSRRWGKHDIKEISEERFQYRGTKHGSGCGGH